jgi:hypothetical protein
MHVLAYLLEGIIRSSALSTVSREMREAHINAAQQQHTA